MATFPCWLCCLFLNRPQNLFRNAQSYYRYPCNFLNFFNNPSSSAVVWNIISLQFSFPWWLCNFNREFEQELEHERFTMSKKESGQDPRIPWGWGLQKPSYRFHLSTIPSLCPFTHLSISVAHRTEFLPFAYWMDTVEFSWPSAVGSDSSPCCNCSLCGF